MVSLRYIAPMSLLIRTLLTWLLVLAVPAQGLAAASMSFCGAGHSSSQSQTADVALSQALSQTQSLSHSQSHSHAAADNAASPHQHRAMSAAADDGKALSGATDDAQSPHATSHKCSACASCCSTAALPSAALTVPAAERTCSVFSAVVPSVDVFTADGLERPPRAALA